MDIWQLLIYYVMNGLFLCSSFEIGMISNPKFKTFVSVSSPESHQRKPQIPSHTNTVTKKMNCLNLKRSFKKILLYGIRKISKSDKMEENVPKKDETCVVNGQHSIKN